MLHFRFVASTISNFEGFRLVEPDSFPFFDPDGCSLTLMDALYENEQLAQKAMEVMDL